MRIASGGIRTHDTLYSRHVQVHTCIHIMMILLFKVCEKIDSKIMRFIQFVPITCSNSIDSLFSCGIFHEKIPKKKFEEQSVITRKGNKHKNISVCKHLYYHNSGIHVGMMNMDTSLP